MAAPRFSNKQMTIAAAVGAVLVAVVGVAFLVGSSVTTSAQEQATTTTVAATDTTEVASAGPRQGGRNLGNAVDLAAAAEVLGMTEAELETALESGESIASVAEEQGVDVQTVIDTLVAQASAALDERVAGLKQSLPAQIERLVNREGGLQSEGGPRGGQGRDQAQLDLAVAAEALGVTDEELRTALQEGESIATVAEAEGVELQTVIDALVAAATAELDERVAAGTLDAEEAERRKEQLPARVAQLVEAEGGGSDRGSGDSDSDAAVARPRF
jgi:hypothetical protein